MAESTLGVRFSDEVPTTGSVELPPEPRSLEALGRHHSLEAALAELVDNASDAGARHVLIRFVRDRGRLVRLLVVDDGSGIVADRIDVAMTVGGGRPYGAREIGRFGLGLKAASFSQARSVTVVSRAQNAPATGRRWRLEQAKKDFRCEIVDSTFATSELAEDWGFPHFDTGTVVRWDDVKAFPRIRDEDAVDRFLRGAFARIRGHLGLVFHRLLDGALIHVLVDVEEPGEGIILRNEVSALNPFGYSRTGAAGWPKTLHARAAGGELELVCHIWPGRSNAEEFRLDGNALERQGLYVYFNDRLVQRGGWNGLVHPEKQLSLARVRVDVEGDVEQLLVLKPEKHGIEVGPQFGRAVDAAQSEDGSSFSDYIEQARDAFKEANRRRRVRTPVVPPGSGFDPKLRRAITRELPVKDDETIEFRWTQLPPHQFFDLDREERTLWLNKRYRHALLGGRRGGLNDLPVVKALMYLLTENIFAGQNLGPRDKDNLEVWQAILTAAARLESS